MPRRTGALPRFRDGLEKLLLGVEAALENAQNLLAAASATAVQSESTASFLASIAAEELGKALLLRDRFRILLNNADIRVHSRMFADDPEWIALGQNLASVLPWGTFAGRPGSHKGGLHDHVAKLNALRDYYRDALPQVVKATSSELVLASIDVFAGNDAVDVRKGIENSLYVAWDEAANAWRRPRCCIVHLPEFLDAMREVRGRLAADLSAERTHFHAQLQYLARAPASLGLSENEVFRLDGPA